jgi:hypothetical protein
MKPYFTKPLCAAVLALAPNLSVAENCYFDVQAEYYNDAQSYSRDFLKPIIGQDIQSKDLPGGTVHVTKDCRKLRDGLTVYRRHLRPQLEDLRDEVYDNIIVDREEGYLNCARRGSRNYDVVVHEMDNMLSIAAEAWRNYKKNCDGNLHFDEDDLS